MSTKTYGVFGPCANLLCSCERADRRVCRCAHVTDTPVTLRIGNLHSTQYGNLEALKAKFADRAAYPRGIDPKVLAIGYSRTERSVVKVDFSNGAAASAAHGMVHRFVDHSAAVTAELRGWRHTPFTPGCKLANTVDVPGGAYGFRSASPALREHYHLQLLGDGVVMLCKKCIDRLRDVPDLAADHLEHAQLLVCGNSPHAALLPHNTVHALASYMVLQYWLDGQAKRGVWFPPVTSDPQMSGENWGGSRRAPLTLVQGLDAAATGIDADGAHAHRRSVFLATLLPLLELVLATVGLGSVVVALEAVYALVFWRHVGTRLKARIAEVTPARAAAVAAHTLSTATNWRSDWASQLMPQPLCTLLTFATASDAELRGEVNTVHARRHFTQRYGASQIMLHMADSRLVEPVLASFAFVQKFLGQSKAFASLGSALFGTLTYKSVRDDVQDHAHGALEMLEDWLRSILVGGAIVAVAGDNVNWLMSFAVHLFSRSAVKRDVAIIARSILALVMPPRYDGLSMEWKALSTITVEDVTELSAAEAAVYDRLVRTRLNVAASFVTAAEAEAQIQSHRKDLDKELLTDVEAAAVRCDDSTFQQRRSVRKERAPCAAGQEPRRRGLSRVGEEPAKHPEPGATEGRDLADEDLESINTTVLAKQDCIGGEGKAMVTAGDELRVWQAWDVGFMVTNARTGERGMVPRAVVEGQIGAVAAAVAAVDESDVTGIDGGDGATEERVPVPTAAAMQEDMRQQEAAMVGQLHTLVQQLQHNASDDVQVAEATQPPRPPETLPSAAFIPNMLKNTGVFTATTGKPGNLGQWNAAIGEVHDWIAEVARTVGVRLPKWRMTISDGEPHKLRLDFARRSAKALYLRLRQAEEAIADPDTSAADREAARAVQAEVLELATKCPEEFDMAGLLHAEMNGACATPCTTHSMYVAWPSFAAFCSVGLSMMHVVWGPAFLYRLMGVLGFEARHLTGLQGVIKVRASIHFSGNSGCCSHARSVWCMFCRATYQWRGRSTRIVRARCWPSSC
eukprot:COSAG01_NODE_3841_length_5646_cov_2.225527_2_plen_1025_part_00